MRAKRRTEQEQYEIIMECRRSGLSDHQWCLEHYSGSVVKTKI